METEITERVGPGWGNSKKCNGAPCDRMMAAKLKGNVYKSVTRAALARARNVGYNEETGKSD